MFARDVGELEGKAGNHQGKTCIGKVTLRYSKEKFSQSLEKIWTT